MSTPENNDDENPLQEKLEELESLLDADNMENKATRIHIPVLDELVSESDFIDHEDENDIEQIEAQISDLTDKLEHKFSGELDELVSLLKDNLKGSIVEKLCNHDKTTAEEKPEDGLSSELESDIQKKS